MWHSCLGHVALMGQIGMKQNFEFQKLKSLVEVIPTNKHLRNLINIERHLSGTETNLKD